MTNSNSTVATSNTAASVAAATDHSRPSTNLPDYEHQVEEKLQHDSQQGEASRRNIKNHHRIFLFDVDGTLTVPRKHATSEMKEFLQKLRQHALIGVVGGSDLVKQVEQLGEDLLHVFDYVFSENGLMSYKYGKLIHQQSFVQYTGEESLQLLLNAVLHYIADLQIPIKRGTFIEFRNGMLNISPIGRNCSQSERDEFEKYDQKHHIRRDMVKTLTEKFSKHPVLSKLKYSIGGQISFDVFPIGWDKTYCIQFLHTDNIKQIYFYGDKTYEGGNDYEIYVDQRVKGYSVKSPDDTITFVKEIIEKEDGIKI